MEHHPYRLANTSPWNSPAAYEPERSVRSIPDRHLRRIMDERSDPYAGFTDDSECVEDMLGQNPPTWGEIAVCCVAVLGLTLFVWALDAGMIG